MPASRRYPLKLIKRGVRMALEAYRDPATHHSAGRHSASPRSGLDRYLFRGNTVGALCRHAHCVYRCRRYVMWKYEKSITGGVIDAQDAQWIYHGVDRFL